MKAYQFGGMLALSAAILMSAEFKNSSQSEAQASVSPMKFIVTDFGEAPVPVTITPVSRVIEQPQPASQPTAAPQPQQPVLMCNGNQCYWYYPSQGTYSYAGYTRNDQYVVSNRQWTRQGLFNRGGLFRGRVFARGGCASCN